MANSFPEAFRLTLFKGTRQKGKKSKCVAFFSKNAVKEKGYQLVRKATNGKRATKVKVSDCTILFEFFLFTQIWFRCTAFHLSTLKATYTRWSKSRWTVKNFYLKITRLPTKDKIKDQIEQILVLFINVNAQTVFLLDLHNFSSFTNTRT